MNDTNQSTEIGELSKALSVAQGQLQAVPRNAENPFFKSSYADLAAIIAAARSILAAHGLSIVQFGLPTDNGKVALATQLNHISGQWVRGVMVAKPVKDDPQAMGSCVTYLRRYGWQAMLGLVQEGEDDDGNTASDKGSDKGRVTGDQPKQSTAHKPTESDMMMWEAAKPAKTPPVASATATTTETPEARYERFIALFRPYASAADKVFRDHGLILPTDDASDIDDVKISAMTRANVNALLEEVKQVHGGKEPPVLSEGDAPLPDDLHKPEDFTVHPPTDEPWRAIVIPFGKHKGATLGAIEKGQLWWFVTQYKPDRWHNPKTDKWFDPRPADVAFYKALQPYREEIIKRYDFNTEDKRD